MKTVEYLANIAMTGDKNKTATKCIEEFENIEYGYLGDVIDEIADSCADIYTQELIDYALNNRRAVDEALDNGIALSGYDYFSLYKNADYEDYLEHLGASAEFCAAQSAMHRYLSNCVIYAIISFFGDKLGDSITPEQADIIERYADNATIEDHIEDIFELCGQELFKD